MCSAVMRAASVVGDEVFLKLLRNFEVFSLRGRGVSFDDFEVSEDGNDASDVGCEVSVVGDEVFLKLLRKYVDFVK